MSKLKTYHLKLKIMSIPIVWIIFGVLFILSLIASKSVESKFKRYSKIAMNYGMTGREVAEQMLLECLKVAPNLFANCGPSCLFGPCPEGRMSCGKAKEMREKYGR